MKTGINIFILFFTLIMLIGCHKSIHITSELENAELLMESKPDSALTILNGLKIDAVSEKESARYSLLMSMALDKNYIDKITFEVLQPALDYYLRRGNNDEKLRTLYYRGRIYQNRGDVDNAMQSFIEALDLQNEIRDSLTYARILVAQASLYASVYKTQNVISNNLKASKIFGQVGCQPQRLRCLIRAFDGSVILNNKRLSDSILMACDTIVNLHQTIDVDLTACKLAYSINYGTKSDIISAISNFSDYADLPFNLQLDLAYGYYKIGDEPNALKCLSKTRSAENTDELLKYLAIETAILEGNNDYAGALDAYRSFSSVLDSVHNELFSHDLLFAQKKHDIELNALRKSNKKDRIIWLSLCCLFALGIFAVLIYNRYIIVKSKRVLAEKERANIKVERDALANENKRLALEKQNIELERNRKILETENLELRIVQLEAESANLKDVLQKYDELSEPIQNSIKERIEMLNSLLAEKITDNDNYSKQYDKWVEQIINDRHKFMDSTRLAFKASHPKFIKYFEDHNLTDEEINFICLFALGLRGKEVGEYIKNKRHYNLSSAIRKKLGIDEHDTNLGIYVRKLLKQ